MANACLKHDITGRHFMPDRTSNTRLVVSPTTGSKEKF